MKFAIGSTKAGLQLKDEIADMLREMGHDVQDLGMKAGGEFVPYYTAAANVAGALSRGEVDQAVLVCGTGAGSVIVANKFKGVHAVAAGCEYEGSRAAIINDANCLCLGEWLTPPQHGKEIVKAWLDAEFGEGFAPEWVQFLRNGVDEVKKIEGNNLA